MKILSFLFLCLVLIGCASTEPEAVITPLAVTELLGAPTGEERDSIMESVFRHMCQPEPVEKDVSHNVNRVHKVYFLMVGDSHDPSPEFLKRLSGLNAPVKPISEGKWKSFFIYDRVTGERGAAFYVKRITMISRDEADVEAVIHPGGGLSASGPIYRVTRKDGRWIITGERLKWIS
jgi:hypothetical protein